MRANILAGKLKSLLSLTHLDGHPQSEQPCFLEVFEGAVMAGNAGESNIAVGVMRIADAQASGIATFNKCRKDIPGLVKLTQGDLAPSVKRPGEPMWHQIVRNIKSHDVAGTNYIQQGLLEHVPRTGYRITAAGKAHLRKFGY